MMKPLVGLAAFVSAMTATAQSSITVFGAVDTAISGYANTSKDSAGARYRASSTRLSTSGYNFSRLGLRATEDLGGGLAAGFWLEAGLNADTGTGFAKDGSLQFNRRSTVSLTGPFGEIRLGRDYVPTFWSDTVFDPFNGNGAGISLINTASSFSTANAARGGFAPNGIYVRTSNAVGYLLPPDLGGLYGQLMYAFNEAASFDPGVLTKPAADSRAGRYLGGRIGYAKGPLDVALAVASNTTASQYFSGSTTRLRIWNLGASYDFGALKVFGEYSSNRQRIALSGAAAITEAAGSTEPGANGALIGVSVPLGAGLVRASYSRVDYRHFDRAHPGLPGLSPNPKAGKLALGYVHRLSKRTALYATVARLENRNGADLTNGGPNFIGPAQAAAARSDGARLPYTSVGYDFGIRHAF